MLLMNVHYFFNLFYFFTRITFFKKLNECHITDNFVKLNMYIYSFFARIFTEFAVYNM